MVRFKVEAVQLHWVAADNHVIQSRQSSLTSLTGSWPAPIWSLSPLRLCSLQSQVCWWLAPCFWNPPAAEPWDLACLAGPGVQRSSRFLTGCRLPATAFLIISAMTANTLWETRLMKFGPGPGKEVTTCATVACRCNFHCFWLKAGMSKVPTLLPCARPAMMQCWRKIAPDGCPWTLKGLLAIIISHKRTHGYTDTYIGEPKICDGGGT